MAESHPTTEKRTNSNASIRKLITVEALERLAEIAAIGFGLAKLLPATRRRRTLRIWDRKGLVFVAERLDTSPVQVRFSIRFAVLKFEGKPDNRNSPHIWIRDGKMIIIGTWCSEKRQPPSRNGVRSHGACLGGKESQRLRE
jgi:hypothetical protein